MLFVTPTPNDVSFSNDHTAVIVYSARKKIPLGTHVMYQMSPEWWGYVGKVIATCTWNAKQELFIQYDKSVAGFPTQKDAHDYFDKIV
jgi:hypothetical protein